MAEMVSVTPSPYRRYVFSLLRGRSFLAQTACLPVGREGLGLWISVLNPTLNQLAKISLADVGGNCTIKSVFAMADKYKGV